MLQRILAKHSVLYLAEADADADADTDTFDDADGLGNDVNPWLVSW